MGLEALPSRRSPGLHVPVATSARPRPFGSPGVDGAVPDLEGRIKAAALFGHNIALLRPSGSRRTLPRAVRNKMEKAFGRDFSHVRIHEDRSPLSLGAVAYTRGRDIHFAPGQYQPGSTSGQELIGHELTHVVQQQAGQVVLPQGKHLPINQDSRLEAEADAMGARATRGIPLAGIGGARSASPTRATSPSGATGPVQCMLRNVLKLGNKKQQLAKSFSSTKKTDSTDIVGKILAKNAQIQERNANLQKLIGNQKTTPSFRYLDAEKPQDFQSPLMKNKGPKAMNDVLEKVKRDPSLKKKLAKGHETGELHDKSPFVSVAKDFMKVANTTDPWLAEITEKVPHLALLLTPEGSLRPPHSALSKKETEHLYMGSDLQQYTSKIIPNPMQGGIPRLSTLPPDFIGALGEQGGRRFDRGREAQHEKRFKRLQKKLGTKK